MGDSCKLAGRTQCIRAELGVLEVASDLVTVPLLAAVFRAILGRCDLSEHLAGPTGVGKTELAALAAQHFGPSMDSRHLPASWSSTGNSLEALAFLAKDVVLPVDDFAPGGTVHDVQRLHREADRVLRAQGNRSARQRLRPDGSLRPARPPRSLILSTGEDVPKGQSLRARAVVVEIGPSDVAWERMGEAQRAAAAGVYARATSAFVAWLAGRYEEVTKRFRTRTETLRNSLLSGPYAHRRSAANVAQLIGAFETYLDFALDVGGVGADEAAELRRRANDAMEKVAAAQERHLAMALK